MTRRWQYDSVVTSVSQDPEVVHADAFQSPTEQPVRKFAVRKQAIAFLAVVPSLFFTNIFPAQPLDWQQPQSQPQIVARKLTVTYPNFWIDGKQLTQPEQVSADKFAQPQSKPVLRTRNYSYLYPSFFNDEFSAALGAEVITVDKWFPGVNQPQPKVVHREFQFPNLTIDPSVLTLDSLDWLMPTSQPRSKVQRDYQSFFFGYDEPKLFASTNQPYFVKKKLQYPAFFNDGFQTALVPPETITVDKWYSIIQPRLTPKQLTWTYPSLSYYPLPIAAIPATSRIIIVDGKPALQVAGIYYTLL